jgi:subtilisin family serine protease
MKKNISLFAFIALFSLIAKPLHAADTLKFDLIIIFTTTTTPAQITAFSNALHATELGYTIPSRARLWRCWLISGDTLRVPDGAATSITTPSQAVGVVAGSGHSDGVGLNGLYIIPEFQQTQRDSGRPYLQTYVPSLLGSCINDADTATIHKCTPSDYTVRIAIIDSGVDCAQSTANPKEIEVFHAALQPYVARDSRDSLDGIDNDPSGANGYTDDLIGYDFVNNDGIPQDGTGHGTFVTGVIAQILKANKPSFTPNIKFLTLRVLDNTNSGYEFDIIRAVDYAIKKKVNIINGSFVSADKLLNLIDKPLSYAFKVASDSGIIVSVAAGNRGLNIDDSLYSPPSYINDNLLVTGGTTCFSNIATFSNYGASSVDIFAPATSLYSTWKRTTGICTTNCYAVYSGTSFAAPQTTAVAALLMAKSNFSPTQGRLVKCAILSSAAYRPFLLGKARRAGMLNGLGACNIINTVTLPCNERVGNEDIGSTNLNNFEVAPNPFSDAVTIRFSLREATEVSVSIISLTGQTITSERFKGTIGENYHPLSIKAVDGIYFIQIHAGNGVVTRKVIKF